MHTTGSLSAHTVPNVATISLQVFGELPHWVTWGVSVNEPPKTTCPAICWPISSGPACLLTGHIRAGSQDFFVKTGFTVANLIPFRLALLAHEKVQVREKKGDGGQL